MLFKPTIISMAVTIYNTNLAPVKDTRVVRLQNGLNLLGLNNGAATIENILELSPTPL